MAETFMQQRIGAYIGRLFRDSFGRGPRSAYVSLGNEFVIIHLVDFLSPVEEILLEEGQERSVIKMRDTLMRRLSPDIKGSIGEITGEDIEELYYDWSLVNRSGLIVAVAKTREAFGRVRDLFKVNDELLTQFLDVSVLTQREPKALSAYQIDPGTLIIVREGILLPVEKEIINLGDASYLKHVKRGLELRHLQNRTQFETLYGRNVTGTFVDWDFHLDKCLTVFKLK
ncbi:DUF2294 domain-containing protein [Alicyclobacillus dauci]|uniref:DUF2294 domain-containing protein n=1 Tax=Alicyclobacillus dauci TaxID=1475485 RepID=A0ABY6YYP7_9BACL|nr:Na-translocating system protein MpsC family protein [Alicyclobacillus dauci]WAH35428.1 DUF2294 domain-containing protein [Alicyclobacillus dauci]